MQGTGGEVLDAEICDTIVDLIAFGDDKNLFECTCQTSEGNKVLVRQVYADGRGGHQVTKYHVQVWANDRQSDDDQIILDIIIHENALKTIISLKNELSLVTSKRSNLNEEDSKLAAEELDLERHVTAAVMALCFHSEG